MKNKVKTDVVEKENIQPNESKDVNKNKEFNDLIKGEYKDAFSEKVKDIIAKRLKGFDELKAKMSDIQEVIDILADKYNIDKNDLTGLLEKVKSDDSLIADNAKEKGMDVENYRYIKSLEKENEYYKALQKEQKQKNAMRAQIKKWYDESEEVSGIYEDFDINSEIENEKFIELLRNGVDMKTAYEIVHHEDIIESIKRKAAEKAEKETSERLLSMDRRPVENGLSAQSPAIIKTDVSKLTPQQRANIAKRVSMGETITF